MLALDRAQRESAKFLTFMSQYMCHATSAGRKAGSVSTNNSQFVDTLSTNKAYLIKSSQINTNLESPQTQANFVIKETN